MNKQSEEKPIRINRYLYLNNVCSRRAADRLIEAGAVLVNGKKAQIGQKITSVDKVELLPKAKDLLGEYKYFIFNKPRGVVSHNPQRNEVSAVEYAKLPKNFFPVGRLDKASSGLMLLTNDGRIVNKILNPEFAHERVYTVVVNKPLKDKHLKMMQSGVNIEGYITKPAKTKKLSEREFMISLTEGKKHQIRRMCAALGYTVENLKRIQMLNLKLDVKEGDKRELTKQEKQDLFNLINLRDS